MVSSTPIIPHTSVAFAPVAVQSRHAVVKRSFPLSTFGSTMTFVPPVVTKLSHFLESVIPLTYKLVAAVDIVATMTIFFYCIQADAIQFLSGLLFSGGQVLHSFNNEDPFVLSRNFWELLGAGLQIWTGILPWSLLYYGYPKTIYGFKLK